MVTGDHVRTAVSVAHLCNILPVRRPVLLMDVAPVGAIGSSPVALSVLYPDGSVNHTVSRAVVLPQVSIVVGGHQILGPAAPLLAGLAV